jgi:polyhydroxybutyrate depolymerase
MRACAAWACSASLALLLLSGPPAWAESMTSGGTTRHYELYVPPGPGPWPAVFLLHGGAGTAAGMRRYTDFDRFAAAAGIVAVYPQGIDRHWNDQRGPGVESEADDERFLLDLIDRLASQGLIDRTHVYIAGISNGALMALQMACAHADRIAGIAVIAGSLPTGYQCQPARPLPVVFFNGTKDRFIPFGGGPIAPQFYGDRGSVVPVGEAIAFFAEANGCRQRSADPLHPPVPPDGTEATIYRYGDCRPGGALESVVIEGGGHSWPGARQGLLLDGILGTASRAIDANAELWRFFSRATAP